MYCYKLISALKNKAEQNRMEHNQAVEAAAAPPPPVNPKYRITSMVALFRVHQCVTVGNHCKNIYSFCFVFAAAAATVGAVVCVNRLNRV